MSSCASPVFWKRSGRLLQGDAAPPPPVPPSDLTPGPLPCSGRDSLGETLSVTSWPCWEDSGSLFADLPDAYHDLLNRPCLWIRLGLWSRPFCPWTQPCLSPLTHLSCPLDSCCLDYFGRLRLSLPVSSSQLPSLPPGLPSYCGISRSHCLSLLSSRLRSQCRRETLWVLSRQWCRLP